MSHASLDSRTETSTWSSLLFLPHGVCLSHIRDTEQYCSCRRLRAGELRDPCFSSMVSVVDSAPTPLTAGDVETVAPPEQLLEDVERRQKAAAAAGLGFEVPEPSSVPNLPKTPQLEGVAIAA
jgi:hypothetical protein